MEKSIIRVMFTGDSITDVNRGRPIGEMSSLGDSYVSNIYVQTVARNPLCRMRFLNSATSGNTSRQLLARFDTEVLSYNPDWLFIMIGINDCWRCDTNKVLPETWVSADEHREYVEDMLVICISAGVKPVLVSPFFLGQDKTEFMRRMCDELNVIQKELAAKYSIGYIDVQTPLDDFVKAMNTTYFLSSDRVHPNAYGKQIITNAIMESPVYKELLYL